MPFFSSRSSLFLLVVALVSGATTAQKGLRVTSGHHDSSAVIDHDYSSSSSSLEEQNRLLNEAKETIANGRKELFQRFSGSNDRQLGRIRTIVDSVRSPRPRNRKKAKDDAEEVSEPSTSGIIGDGTIANIISSLVPFGDNSNNDATTANDEGTEGGESGGGVNIPGVDIIGSLIATLLPAGGSSNNDGGDGVDNGGSSSGNAFNDLMQGFVLAMIGLIFQQAMGGGNDGSDEEGSNLQMQIFSILLSSIIGNSSDSTNFPAMLVSLLLGGGSNSGGSEPATTDGDATDGSGGSDGSDGTDGTTDGSAAIVGNIFTYVNCGTMNQLIPFGQLFGNLLGDTFCPASLLGGGNCDMVSALDQAQSLCMNMIGTAEGAAGIFTGEQYQCSTACMAFYTTFCAGCPMPESAVPY